MSFILCGECKIKMCVWMCIFSYIFCVSVICMSESCLMSVHCAYESVSVSVSVSVRL